MDGYICQPFISLEVEIDNTKQIRLVLNKGKEVVSPTPFTKRSQKQAAAISSTTISPSNQKFLWKTKQRPLHTHQASTTKPFQCPPVSTAQRYVPKKLLEAQRGCNQIWVPKQIHNKAANNSKLPLHQPNVTAKIPVQQTKPTISITQTWVPKSTPRVQKVSPNKTTLVWQIKSPSTHLVTTQPTATNIDWHLQLLSKKQITFDGWIILVQQQQVYIPIPKPTITK